MTFKPTPMRAHNGYDTELASNQAAIEPAAWGPSLTAQDMAEDADINVLMRRFGLTGKFPENPKIPMYGDFTDIPDLRTALDAVREANEMFMTYPADLRGRFQNDSVQFAEFCLNPANKEEMQRLGLLKEPPPAPIGATGPGGPPSPTGQPVPPKTA